MKSPHDILGVSPDASKEEIKRAYKKLAMKAHPDKGGDPERFKEISGAYEAMMNPSPEFSPEFPGVKLRTHVHHVKLSLDDIMQGTQVNLKVTLTTSCTSCQNVCPQCRGTGSMSPIPVFIIPCMACHGQGVSHRGCSQCSQGKKLVEKKIEITVEPGTHDGHTVVFEGYGEQKSKMNEVSGDLVVVIESKPHPLFTREGDLLVYTHQLKLCDMIIGTHFEIPVPFLPIKVQKVSVPGIINPEKPYIIPSIRLKILWVVDYSHTKTLTDIEKQIILKILGPS